MNDEINRFSACLALLYAIVDAHPIGIRLIHGSWNEWTTDADEVMTLCIAPRMTEVYATHWSFAASIAWEEA